MAGIGKFTVRGALNAERNALYDEQTVLTVSDTTSTVQIDPKYNFVYIQSSEDIYYTWATTTTDAISTTNGLYLMGGDDVYILSVPWGKALVRTADIYLHLQRKTSISSTVRHVLA